MSYKSTTGVALAVALLLASGIAIAQEKQDRNEQTHQGGARTAAPRAQAHPAAPRARTRPPAPQAETHPGPRGYARVTEPQGWNTRPAAVDRNAYQHTYRAPRAFKIGPYHRPVGWTAHRWNSGQILPRGYWAPQYLIADYWLFGLEVPPPGYEWVRDDDDAILVSVNTGEILQVMYGVYG